MSSDPYCHDELLEHEEALTEMAKVSNALLREDMMYFSMVYFSIGAVT